MTTQFVELSVFEAMGLVGVAFYLGSYASLQFGIIDGKRMIYPFFKRHGRQLRACFAF